MLSFLLAAATLINFLEGSVSFQPQGLVLGSFLNKRQKHYKGTNQWLDPNSNPQKTLDYCRDGLFASSLLGSSSFWMSDFPDQSYESTKVDLSYLPLSLMNVPAGSEMILHQVTDAYVRSDLEEVLDNIKLDDVLETIDDEYKYTPLPLQLKLGNQTFIKVETRKRYYLDAKTEASRVVSKVLAFAAIHRLPANVARLLFSNLAEEYLKEYFTFTETPREIQLVLQAFEEYGWNGVDFSRGLPLTIKRDYDTSRRNRYRPWPRKSLLTRSKDISEAKKAIQEANQTKPPTKFIPKKITMEEIDEFVNQFNIRSELSEEQHSIKDMLTFFPNRKSFMSKNSSPLVREITKRKSQIISAGRAGFVAYAMVAYCMYTISMISKWRLLTLAESQSLLLVHGKYNVIQNSLNKFFKLFVSTYFSKPYLSKLQRLIISCLLAPLGNFTLKVVQRKLKISDNKAIGLISSTFIFLSIGLWCTILFKYIVFSGSTAISLTI